MEHVETVEVNYPVLTEVDSMNAINIPGMYPIEVTDEAVLPGSIRYIPVPPGSEPHLEWSVGAVENTNWNDRMILASTPEFSGSGLETTEEFYPVDFPSAHDPVSFEVIHILGTTVARVHISPFCYGTPSQYAKQINYSLSVPDAAGGRPVEGTLLQSLCPNSERWWPYTQRSQASTFWGKPWARIKVKNTGFYSVTCEELEASGCAVSGVPSASLAMFAGPGEMFDPENPGDSHELASVSIKVFDGGDGIFDQADSLVFFGQGLWHWNFESDSLYRSFHRFDDSNTYWLTWGGENGNRMESVDVTPSGGTEINQGIVTFGYEQEIFWEHAEHRTGWLWGFLSSEFASYFYLGSPFASENATLRLSVINETYSTHRVWAELEGISILDTLGNRRIEHFTIENVSVNQEGNILKIWSDHPYNSFFNYAEILLSVDLSASAGYMVVLEDYVPGLHFMSIGSVSTDAEIYDLTDPFHPVKFTGWSFDGTNAGLSVNMSGDLSVFWAIEPSFYLSPENIEPAQPGRILGASSPADVIITVPEVLIDGIAVLEAIYASRGLSVLTVTYKEIYDEFGQGVSDPGAVRSLVRWALDTWPDPPQALLLIGDGSNDPLGYSTGYKTIAPVNVELQSDNCEESYFTTVHTNSEHPEIPVSRIPASTINELLVVCEKTVTVENSANHGPWSNTVFLVADDEWGKGESSNEFQSTDICELLADSIVPFSANVVKLYEIEYPWPAGTTVEGIHPTKPEASSDFIDQLNKGVLYVSFFGHGSYDQMTHEKLFASSMISQLCNAPRYFLYNSFSCDNGFFDLAAADCIAENLLFHPQGGAVATVACTRASWTPQNEVLSSAFMSLLHQGTNTLAEALWLSQLSVGNMNNYLYPVLGDGGMTLPWTETEGYSVMPEDTLTRGQISTVDVSFTQESSFLFRCLESADSVVYVSPLKGNCTIEYLRYGSELYSSILSTDQSGDISVNFFVPLQADTGFSARCDGTGRIGSELGTAYAWPVPLIDTGDYADDTQGPDIELSFPASQGDEIPSVYQNANLRAVLSDPSGICVLGNDAGSIIIGSVDGGYEDITELFSYNQGSYTTGTLNYQIPDLLPGLHEIRVVARDGMKNTGEAVLNFTVLSSETPLLEKTGVYPNPVQGPRAFFFTTSSTGTVEVTVYTIAGRPVWRDEILVQDGAGQLLWNGLDSDGDSIAAGAYVYIIKFSGGSGGASATDVLVVSP